MAENPWVHMLRLQMEQGQAMASEPYPYPLFLPPQQTFGQTVYREAVSGLVGGTIGSVPGFGELVGVVPTGTTEKIHDWFDEKFNIGEYEKRWQLEHPAGRMIGSMVGDLLGMFIPGMAAMKGAKAIYGLEKFRELASAAPTVARGMQHFIEGIGWESGTEEPDWGGVAALAVGDMMLRSYTSSQIWARLFKRSERFPLWDFENLKWLTLDDLNNPNKFGRAYLFQALYGMARNLDTTPGTVAMALARTHIADMVRPILDDPANKIVSGAAEYTTLLFKDGSRVQLKTNHDIINALEALSEPRELDKIVTSQGNLLKLRRQLLSQEPEEVRTLAQLAHIRGTTQATGLPPLRPGYVRLFNIEIATPPDAPPGTPPQLGRQLWTHNLADVEGAVPGPGPRGVVFIDVTPAELQGMGVMDQAGQRLGYQVGTDMLPRMNGVAPDVIEYARRQQLAAPKLARNLFVVRDSTGVERALELNAQNARRVRSDVLAGNAHIVDFVYRDPANYPYNPTYIDDFLKEVYGKRYNWEAPGVYIGETLGKNSVEILYTGVYTGAVRVGELVRAPGDNTMRKVLQLIPQTRVDAAGNRVKTGKVFARLEGVAPLQSGSIPMFDTETLLRTPQVTKHRVVKALGADGHLDADTLKLLGDHPDARVITLNIRQINDIAIRYRVASDIERVTGQRRLRAAALGEEGLSTTRPGVSPTTADTQAGHTGFPPASTVPAPPSGEPVSEADRAFLKVVFGTNEVADPATFAQVTLPRINKVLGLTQLLTSQGARAEFLRGLQNAVTNRQLSPSAYVVSAMLAKHLPDSLFKLTTLSTAGIKGVTLAATPVARFSPVVGEAIWKSLEVALQPNATPHVISHEVAHFFGLLFSDEQLVRISQAIRANIPDLSKWLSQRQQVSALAVSFSELNPKEFVTEIFGQYIYNRYVESKLPLETLKAFEEGVWSRFSRFFEGIWLGMRSVMGMRGTYDSATHRAFDNIFSLIDREVLRLDDASVQVATRRLADTHTITTAFEEAATKAGLTTESVRAVLSRPIAGATGVNVEMVKLLSRLTRDVASLEKSRYKALGPGVIRLLRGDIRTPMGSDDADSLIRTFLESTGYGDVMPLLDDMNFPSPNELLAALNNPADRLFHNAKGEVFEWATLMVQDLKNLQAILQRSKRPELLAAAKGTEHMRVYGFRDPSGNQLRILPIVFQGDRALLLPRTSIGEMLFNANPASIGFRTEEFITAAAGKAAQKVREQWAVSLTSKFKGSAESLVGKVKRNLITALNLKSLDVLDLHITPIIDSVTGREAFTLTGLNARKVLDLLHAQGKTLDDVIYGYQWHGVPQVGRFIQNIVRKVETMGRHKLIVTLDPSLVKPGEMHLVYGGRAPRLIRNITDVRDWEIVSAEEAVAVKQLVVHDLDDAALALERANMRGGAPRLWVSRAGKPPDESPVYIFYLRYPGSPADASRDLVIASPWLYRTERGLAKDTLPGEITHALESGYEIQGVVGDFGADIASEMERVDLIIKNNIRQIPPNARLLTPSGIRFIQKLAMTRGYTASFTERGIRFISLKDQTKGMPSVQEFLHKGDPAVAEQALKWLEALPTVDVSTGNAVLDDIARNDALRFLVKQGWDPDELSMPTALEENPEGGFVTFWRNFLKPRTKDTVDTVQSYANYGVKPMQYLANYLEKILPKTAEGKPVIPIYNYYERVYEGLKRSMHEAIEDYWQLKPVLDKLSRDQKEDIYVAIGHYVGLPDNVLTPNQLALKRDFLLHNEISGDMQSAIDAVASWYERQYAIYQHAPGVRPEGDLFHIFGYVNRRMTRNESFAHFTTDPRYRSKMRDVSFFRPRTPGQVDYKKLVMGIDELVMRYAADGRHFLHLKPVQNEIAAAHAELAALKTAATKANDVKLSRAVTFTMKTLEHMDNVIRGRHGTPDNLAVLGVTDLYSAVLGESSETHNIISRAMSYVYSSTLGFRVMSPIRNRVSTLLLTYPVLGSTHTRNGMRLWHEFTKNPNGELAIYKDAVASSFLPEYEEMTREMYKVLTGRAQGPGATIGKGLDKFAEAGLWGMRKTEQAVRGETYFAGISAGKEVLALARKNGINLNLVESTSLMHFNTSQRERLIGYLERALADPSKEREFLVQYGGAMVKSTMWAYGPLESFALGRTQLGRLAFMYGTWPANYVQYVIKGLGSLLSTQGGKAHLTPYGKKFLARWLSVNAAGAATFQALGVYSGNMWFFGPTEYTGGPALQAAADIYDWIRLPGHESEIAKTRLARQAMTVFMPAGSGVRDMGRFIQYMKEGYPEIALRFPLGYPQPLRDEHLRKAYPEPWF